jgi:hypothetical protein
MARSSADLPPEPPDVEWRAVRGSLDPARVVEFTDPRAGVMYELLAAGGQRWIRRTIRTRRAETVEETPRERAAVTNALWPRLCRRM